MSEANPSDFPSRQFELPEEITHSNKLRFTYDNFAPDGSNYLAPYADMANHKYDSEIVEVYKQPEYHKNPGLLFVAKNRVPGQISGLLYMRFAKSICQNNI